MNVKTIALVIPFLGLGIYCAPQLLKAEIVVLTAEGKKTQVQQGEKDGKINRWKRKTEKEKSISKTQSQRTSKFSEEEEIVIEGEVFGENLLEESPQDLPLPPPID